jgi:lipid-binding SYLF domain-containing protein
VLKTVLSLLLIAGTSSALALDKAQLERRIQQLTAKFEALQSKPDKAIPAETLREAHGIILLERTKAGFVFGYEGGDGITMIKDADTGEWSAPAFLRAREASLGFQAGRQQLFVVILLMNDAVTHALSDPTFKLSDESSQDSDNGNTNSVSRSVLKTKSCLKVFGDRHGAFGGVATKSGAIIPDSEANRIYYGKSVNMEEILVDHKVTPSEAASGLLQRLTPAPVTAGRQPSRNWARNQSTASPGPGPD